MPKLPDYTALGENPVARTTLGRTSYKPTTGQEGAIGQAVANAGHTLGDISSEIERDNIRIDTLMAEDKFNKVREEQQNLTRGEDGFLSKRGEDAVGPKSNIIGDYTTRFKEKVDAIAEELGNDRQKGMLRKRAEVSGLELRQDLLNHVVREKDIYSKQTTDTILRTERANFADRYKDPAGQGFAMTRALDALKKEYARNGFSEGSDVTKGAVQEWQSGAYRSAIERHLADDNDITATKIYKDLKDSKFVFTADDEKAISHELELSSTRGVAFRSADYAITASKGDLSTALSKVKGLQPKAREIAEQRIRQAHSDSEMAFRQHANDSHTVAQQIVDQTGDFNKVPVDVMVRLTPESRSALEQASREKLSGKDPVQDVKAWTDFDQTLTTNREKLAGLTDAEFYSKYWVNFDNEHRVKATALREAAVKAAQGDPDSKIKLEDHLQFKDRGRNILDSMSIVKASKKDKDMSPEEMKMVNEFETEADRRIQDYQRASGKKYVDGDMKQKIMENLAVEKYMKAKVPRDYMWDTTKSVSEMTPEERSKAYVPIDQIKPGDLGRMYNFAKAKGILKPGMTVDQFTSNYKNRIQHARFVAMQGADEMTLEDILRGK